MATIEYWIQLENNPWDICPNNIDRMTGRSLQQITGTPPVTKVLKSPITGFTQNRNMFRPLTEDALILRRYTANWAAPADRKVNPWDLNEPDPTDHGTMGTIPGPVIECTVGDRVVVHFRNHDTRPDKDIKARTHSLHPHGFVFAPTSDGAFPLSPPDPAQPVGAEATMWSAVGVTSLKKGDRVPPPVNTGDKGGTFTYTWDTFGWPTTAGVWLYHDHSICDMENVERGAIGIIVIHNSSDQQEVDIRKPSDPNELDPAFLPGNILNGSPLQTFCFPLPFELQLLPGALETLGQVDMVGARTDPAMTSMSPPPAERGKLARDAEHRMLEVTRAVRRGDLLLELDEALQIVRRFCFTRYRTPPSKALYLQLFHTLGKNSEAGMCINGRKFMGNTPTMIAGPTTLMRFGVVGMGNDFHTFHLHGHRWIIPGPQGDNIAFPPGTIQTSAQVKAVSQFEDTKLVGPANSFVFTIQEGGPSFMGAFPGQALGEWHMHCHVLMHMDDGMMGSLLIINGGELFTPLPVGTLCSQAPPNTIAVADFQFTPNNIMVPSGTNVTFDFQGGTHTVKTVSVSNANPITINNGGGDLDPVPTPSQRVVTITGSSGGQIHYQCGIHGPGMAGTIMIM